MWRWLGTLCGLPQPRRSRYRDCWNLVQSVSGGELAVSNVLHRPAAQQRHNMLRLWHQCSTNLRWHQSVVIPNVLLAQSSKWPVYKWRRCIVNTCARTRRSWDTNTSSNEKQTKWQRKQLADIECKPFNRYHQCTMLTGRRERCLLKQYRDEALTIW